MVIIQNAVYSKVSNDFKQRPSCKKSDQNGEKNQIFETSIKDLN